MAFRIRGSAHYLPKQKVSAEELDERLLLQRGTSRSRFDVDYRHVASLEENALYMGGQAVIAVLSHTGMLMDDIDMLIWASATSHQALPYNAAGLLASLNIEFSLTSLDINTSCLSFLSALELSQCALMSGRYQNIMIVSSEVATVGIPNGDVELSTMFADGATAYILSADTSSRGMFSSFFATYPQGYSYCQIKGGGSSIHPSKNSHREVEKASYFEMTGEKLYRNVVRHINAFFESGLQKANVSRDQIRYVVPHQASASDLRHLQRRLSFNDEQFINIYSAMGNQVAVSLPMALHHLLTRKEPESGDIILMLGSGAGLTLGMGFIEI